MLVKGATGQNNIAPRIQSWFDEAKNIVDCSYFFNFEGCVIATQIHWKMLMVVDDMPFFLGI